MTLILVGNEKGGTGKSTVAVHLALGLLFMGRRVASVDLDTRQQTMTRFFANRANHAEGRGLRLALPDHRLAVTSRADNVAEARSQERDWLQEMCDELSRANDYIVMDGLGSDSPLSRFAHGQADVILTPLNDSLLDLDVLVDLDPDSLAVRCHSRYSEMVWSRRGDRAKAGKPAAHWIVLRNRLASIGAGNMRRVEEVLARLEPELGFTLLPGFAERVIFRELFLHGLCVLDTEGSGAKPTKSQLAASEEVRGLAAKIDELSRPQAAGGTTAAGG